MRTFTSIDETAFHYAQALHEWQQDCDTSHDRCSCVCCCIDCDDLLANVRSSMHSAAEDQAARR